MAVCQHFVDRLRRVAKNCGRLNLNEAKFYARVLLVDEFIGNDASAFVVVLEGVCTLQAVEHHLEGIVQIM